MKLQWRTVMVPTAVYKLLADSGEACGLTENRMATKILADHFGVKVKLPKFQKNALGAPSEAMEAPPAEPPGTVPADVARRGDDSPSHQCILGPGGEWPVRTEVQPPTCTEHHSTMLDYGSEWYCLIGNHSEAKNASPTT